MPFGAARLSFLAKSSVSVAAEVLRRKVGITAVNQTQVSTAQSKFGGASALFDGNDDHLLVNALPSITGDCTIECWGRFDILPWNQTLGGGSYMMVYTGNANNYLLITREGAGSQVKFQIATDNKYGSFTKSGVDLAINTWYHLAIVRSAGVWKAFFNGTELTTFINDSNFTNSGRTENMAFGTIGKFTDSRGSWDGYMDEFRVSNTARYTADFTPSTTPFQNDANTVLLIHADGTNATTFFEDDNGVAPFVARTANTITANGNAQVDTAQSQFDGASALFDGTGDYLSMPDPGDLDFGTGDFTVEMWTRFANTNTDVFLLSGPRQTSSFAFARASDNTIRVGRTNTAWDSTSSASATTANTWQHLAASRQSGTLRIYRNGTQIFSGANTNSYNFTDFLYIGGIPTDGYWMNGHIDEIRVSNIARYTAAFTTPSASFVNDANTKLLIHANGADASTTFTDDNISYRSKKGVTAQNGVAVSTAQSKFGGTSALFNGTNDIQLRVPEVEILTSDFTIEFWFRPNNGTYVLFSNRPSSSFNANEIFAYYISSSNRIEWNINGYGSVSVANTSMPHSNWYHAAWVRSGTTVTLYVNGVAQSGTKTSSTASIGNSTRKTWYFGSIDGVADEYSGHMDEIRFSNIARYTANFTPATQPHVNDANTLLLIHADGTNASTVFTDDNGTGRSQRGITAVGNAQVDTAQSKFGGASALFDGSGDYLIGQSSLVTGTGDFTIELQIRFNSTGAAVLYDQRTFNSGNFSQNSPVLFWENSRMVYYNGNNRITSAETLSTGVWYHIAVSRSSGVSKLFINGTQTSSDYNDTHDNPATGNFGIGINFPGLFTSFNGWIDEIRVSNSARYTANFTAPTAPHQNDANTLLLVHCDGTDASTVFTDDNGVVPYTPS
jgi:hypothetical protein